MENINSNLVGLTDSEVQKRIDEGKVNISTNIKTKSIKRIFCDNIFTLFNLINVILLAALILWVHTRICFYRCCYRKYNYRYSSGNSFQNKR